MNLKRRVGDEAPCCAVDNRRFRLADAIILVAATAVGLFFARFFGGPTGLFSWSLFWSAWVSFREARAANPGVRNGGMFFLTAATFQFVGLILPFLMSWTLGFIPIRLLGPRPKSRRLFSQPGTIAVLASIVAIAFVVLQALMAVLAKGKDEVFQDLDETEVLLVLPVAVSLAVTSAWATLFAGGRWHAEANWIDRGGRVIGSLWIAIGFILLGLYQQIASYAPAFGQRVGPR